MNRSQAAAELSAAEGSAFERSAALRRGRLLLIAAALLWSTSGLFAKAGAFDDWPLEQRGLLLAFWRALFAGLLLVPFVRRPRLDWRMLPMVACFATMNVTFLSAVALNTAANAIWLQNTAPLWVFLIGTLALGRPIDRRDAVPLLACAAGIAVILCFELGRGGQDASGSGSSQLGILCGLIAGVSYAGTLMLLRALRAENPVWLVALNHLATAALLLPYVLWQGLWPDSKQLLLLAAFGLFQMGLPYLLFVGGLRRVPGQEASLIVVLEPLLVPVWVLLFLGQNEFLPWTVAGGGLILAGLLWRYRPRAKGREPTAEDAEERREDRSEQREERRE